MSPPKKNPEQLRDAGQIQGVGLRRAFRKWPAAVWIWATITSSPSQSSTLGGAATNAAIGI